MNMCDNKPDMYDNCIPYEKTINVDKLARAYVPFQIICSYFEPREALINGTIFPSLYQPYE